MNDNSLKASIMRWFVPIFAYSLVVACMMFQFLGRTSQIERVEVEEDMIKLVDGYANDLKGKITSVKNSGNVAGKIANYYTGENTYETKVLLSALTDNGKNYMSVFCWRDGEGIYQVTGDGSTQKGINMAELPYFENVRTTRDGYVYVEDDGIIGKRAVISVTAITNKNLTSGYLLQYYDTNSFASVINKTDFDFNTVFYWVNNEGTVFATTGDQKSELYCDQGNLWEYFRGLNPAGSDVDDMLVRLRGKRNGVSYVELNGKEYAFVYQHIGISDWHLLTVTTESYVDKALNKEWKYVKNMVLSFVILLVVFLVIVVLMNMILRKRDMKKNETLEVKADTDLLTDLNNKLATERKIKEYIAENPGKQGMMFLLDIDNFKKINDTLGHAFGDEVLRTLGRTIRAEVRATDIIGRTGGDEFMIFMKDIKEDSIITKEAKRIEEFFQNFQAGEYVKYAATASIGVAVYPRDAKDFESLYKAADSALYTAKRRGKNQLAFYSDKE